jgi:hemolysin III
MTDRIVLALTAGFALVALGLLVWQSLRVPPVVAGGALIYGMSLAGSAISSLVYNTGYKHSPQSLWRFADHVCIFLLIAGTYTPLLIGGTAGEIMWLLLPVWAVAVVGIALKICLGLRHDRWFVLLYLAMGWMVVFGLGGVMASFRPVVLLLIAIGGLAFSLGSIFYLFDRHWRWGAAAWHSSVLVGISTHFIAIFVFVLPAG